MSVNKIAWLDGVGKDIAVREGEIPVAGSKQIIVRNHAIAVNPIDWKQQEAGVNIKQWPWIPGFDVSGVVYEVGSEVSRFKKGDRVVGHMAGGAFQLYARVDEQEAALLPKDISCARGAVLPTAFSTALTGLLGNLNGPPPMTGLSLPPPSLNPKPSGKTIVVWGASSSVGAMTIQIATAAGVKVIATSSAKNIELAKQCGAVEVFDYKSETVVEDIVKAVQNVGGEFAGVFDPIALPTSLAPVEQIIVSLGGGATVITLPIPTQPKSAKVVRKFLSGSGDLPKPYYESYLEPALHEGKVKTLPEPLVVGKGLESVQQAYAIGKKGVSAQKIVIDLSE